MKYVKYLICFFLGALIALLWNAKEQGKEAKEQIQLVVNNFKDQTKLVISKASFSEIYNYSDSDSYFFDYVSFDKKAIIAVNATIEVGYDLSKLEIQIDSIENKIIINKIPKQEITIIPDVKYFDIQQSQFNTFSKNDLNNINQKSIEKIKESLKYANLKDNAEERLFEELSKIYQLSSVFGWQVENNTKILIPSRISSIKN